MAVGKDHAGGGAVVGDPALLGEPVLSQVVFSRLNCRNRTCKLVHEGKECFQGMRLRHYYMLCGALLRVWSKIASIMADITSTSYLQIVRLKTKEKKKQVGGCSAGRGRRMF